MGILKSIFKDHLDIGRTVLRSADKLRRDLFHPKDDIEPSTHQASHVHLTRQPTCHTTAPQPRCRRVCSQVAIAITSPCREGLASFPQDWRKPGFNWSDLHC